MLSTGSQGSGVDLKDPEIVRMAVLSCTSTKSVWADRAHTGAQYSAAELESDSALSRSVDARAPHVEPARRLSMLFLVLTFNANEDLKIDGFGTSEICTVLSRGIPD